MNRLEMLQDRLPDGWYIDTWSPGDGVTRYRFFHRDGDYCVNKETSASGKIRNCSLTRLQAPIPTQQHQCCFEKSDYFGPSNGRYTALGYKEAATFAAGLGAAA